MYQQKIQSQKTILSDPTLRIPAYLGSVCTIGGSGRVGAEVVVAIAADATAAGATEPRAGAGQALAVASAAARAWGRS